MFLYFIPFLVSLCTTFHTVLFKFAKLEKSPFYLNMFHIAFITILSLLTIIADYIAINSDNLSFFLNDNFKT